MLNINFFVSVSTKTCVSLHLCPAFLTSMFVNVVFSAVIHYTMPLFFSWSQRHGYVPWLAMHIPLLLVPPINPGQPVFTTCVHVPQLWTPVTSLPRDPITVPHEGDVVPFPPSLARSYLGGTPISNQTTDPPEFLFPIPPFRLAPTWGLTASDPVPESA